MNIKAFVAVAAFFFAGCATVKGPDPVLTKEGPTVPSTNAKGQVGIFAKAAAASLKNSEDPGHALLMRTAGYQYVQQNCRDFFATAGENQKWLYFTRDAIGAIGTLATSIVSIKGQSSVRTENVALLTAVGYAGIDIYTRNFLFSAQNISAVEDLVVKALSAHEAESKKVMPQNYGDAAIMIMDHQAICSPIRIAALVKGAIERAEVVAEKSLGGAALAEDIQDNKIRLKLGEALELPSAASIDQVFALYWFAVKGGTTEAENKNVLVPALGTVDEKHSPINKSGTDIGKAKATWPKKEEVLQLLLSLSSSTRVKLEARIAEARKPAPAAAAAGTKSTPEIIGGQEKTRINIQIK